MTLQWLSADATTGEVLDDLVSLEAFYPLRRVIGASSTGQATLYLNGIPQRTADGLPDLTKPPTTAAAPDEWENLVEPAANLLACYDDTDPGQSIQWAGIVWKRTRNTATDTVDLTLATAESYAGRRLMGDYDGSGKGQNAIIAAMIDQFVTPDGGLPFTVLAVTSGGGKVRTSKKYATSEYATVYQRMQELSSANGGPEWTVEWSWDPSHTVLVPTLQVGDRIGTAAPNGVPVAVFDLPGCLRDLTMTEDYTDGKGANVVTCYSSGAGKKIPTSGPVDGPRGRKLRVDLARQPVANVLDNAELVDRATGLAAQLAPGSVGVTLVGDLAASPRLGQDWRLGDDIGYHVDASVKAFPRGLDGVARAVGVAVAADTISPLFTGNTEAS